MNIADSLIQELEMEAATTRRVLERIPDSRLSWKPAERSRSVGQLAWHIATNPGSVTGLVSENPATMPQFGPEPEPASTAELLQTLDASVEKARTQLRGWNDAAITESWSLNAGGKPLMTMPRVAVLRMIMLNHWYHHRGQLSVYLREMGVPVPSIYGPSADENPFA